MSQPFSRVVQSQHLFQPSSFPFEQPNTLSSVVVPTELFTAGGYLVAPAGEQIVQVSSGNLPAGESTTTLRTPPAGFTERVFDVSGIISAGGAHTITCEVLNPDNSIIVCCTEEISIVATRRRLIPFRSVVVLAPGHSLVARVVDAALNDVIVYQIRSWRVPFGTTFSI